ncbi:MAG: hypothetical protein H7Z10_16520 [Gemmatimonadaceae bacterium]|nr:hypothetical protein [Acetobacteraceae bacterium]
MKARSVLVLLALGGCTDLEPYNRPGMWSATGANARNIAAMAANPGDLIRGRGDAGNDGLRSAAAVTRLQIDRPRALLSLSAEVAPGAGAAAAPAAPAP